MGIRAIFGLYLMITTAVTRVRAELGPPAHDMAGVNPQTALTTVLGYVHSGVVIWLYSHFFRGLTARTAANLCRINLKALNWRNAPEWIIANCCG